MMRVGIILILSVLIVSCGSSKRVAHQPTIKKIDVNKEPIKLERPQLPQLKQDTKKTITTTKNTEDYVQRFAAIAVREMHRYGIPASITLAQGILESGSGKSPLAIRSNNHFGIKCHKGWTGKSVSHDDDKIAECFRKYEHPEISYKDHSEFLTTRKRYSKLFKLRKNDYVGWAYGLKQAGYATDIKYPQKLIGLIRKYNLDKYDRDTKNPVPSTVVDNTSTPSQVFYTVKKGDTLYSIARKFNITVESLKQTNRLSNNTINIGQELFLK